MTLRILVTVGVFFVLPLGATRPAASAEDFGLVETQKAGEQRVYFGRAYQFRLVDGADLVLVVTGISDGLVVGTSLAGEEVRLPVGDIKWLAQQVGPVAPKEPDPRLDDSAAKSRERAGDDGEEASGDAGATAAPKPTLPPPGSSSGASVGHGIGLKLGGWTYTGNGFSGFSNLHFGVEYQARLSDTAALALGLVRFAQEQEILDEDELATTTDFFAHVLLYTGDRSSSAAYVGFGLGVNQFAREGSSTFRGVAVGLDVRVGADIRISKSFGFQGEVQYHTVSPINIEVNNVDIDVNASALLVHVGPVVRF